MENRPDVPTPKSLSSWGEMRERGLVGVSSIATFTMGLTAAL